MKYQINYDLMEKVNTANEKLNLKRIMFEEIRYGTFLYSTYLVIDRILNMISERKDPSYMSTYLYYTLTVVSLRALSKYIVRNFIDRKRLQEKATSDLEDLSLDLNNYNGINTDIDTLKDAKVSKVKYDLDLTSFPPVIQHKYISVPSLDESKKVNNTSIHQEHKLLTKKYILS